jgi:hypothetical protein
MHPRQAALLTVANDLVAAMTFPREFHLPPQCKGQDPVNPEGTDLYVWVYQLGELPAAMGFVGKRSKPEFNLKFRTEQARQEYINREAERRRLVVGEKLKQQAERKNFEHNFVKGDILYSSWGYDQTNVDFYQVTDVISSKEIVIRAIGKRVVSGKGTSTEKVMAEPNEFTGPAMRKRPQGSGLHVNVRLNSFSNAYEWDGTPQGQTGGGWGH